MKMLNGSELASYIKDRQAREVRSLRQSLRVEPKLAIVSTNDHSASEVYMRMKQWYGEEIGVIVEVHKVAQSDAPSLIKQLNADAAVHGIIVQLPLDDASQTDAVVNAVAPAKDVDGLGKDAVLDPATPLAILWLLAGYNVDLAGKKIVLVGRGRLVGVPLERLLLASGYDVTSVDDQTTNVPEIVMQADVVITATGVPRLITPDMLKHGAVVVDAGVASEAGKTVGDLAPEAYDRADLTLTPTKGGVGPLTICALFDNTIRAARQSTKTVTK